MAAATMSAQVTVTCTGGSNYGQGEGCDKAFDGSTGSKWNQNVGASGIYALFNTSTSVYVWGYDITTANDNGSYGRLPKKWTLYGSTSNLGADDAGWVALSALDENNIIQQRNFYTQRFFCNAGNYATTAYQYFKLVIEKPASGDMQFSEFKLCYETQPIVTYSWESGDENSKKAVDLLLNQKWENWANSITGSSHAMVLATADGNPHTVKSYSFSTHDDGNDGCHNRAPREWTIEGSNNKEAWFVIDHVVDGKIKDDNYRTFDYTPAIQNLAFKYIRLTLNNMKGTGWSQVGEFHVIGGNANNTVGYKWVEGANVSANLQNALDMNSYTKAEGNDNALPNETWFTIQTNDEQPHTVQSYSFSTHDDGSWNNRAPKSWKLEGSTDNSTWVTIDEVSDGDIPNVNYTVKKFIPANQDTSVRYLRITIHDFKGGYHQFSEFNVVGACNSHSWSGPVSRAATCTEAGGDVYTCSACGAEKMSNVIAATGHSFTNGFCTSCGKLQSDYMSANNEGYYEVSSVNHFKWLAGWMKETESGSFNIRLTLDVDLTGFEGFGNGLYSIPFKGEFDGQGHWLTNFTMTGVRDRQIGLFGRTDGANIHDLGMAGADVRSEWSSQNTGIIVGNAKNTTINRVAVSKNSYVSGHDHVGSIAGNAEGSTTIKNCYVDISVYSSAYQCGGLVGTSKGLTLERCLFLGDVRNGNYNASGLLSLVESDNSTTLQNNIMAATKIETNGKTDYYSLGNTGGNTTTYSNNYVAASTIFKSNHNEASDDLKAGTTLSFDDLNGSNGKTTPVADMQTENFYTSTMGWDMTNDWAFHAEGKYPILQWMVVKISTAADLVAFATKVNGGEYSQVAELTQDIDMTGVTGWTPIGQTDDTGDGNNGDKAYKGTFNGNGHTIDNLREDVTTFNNQGLFGVVNGGCTIKNLILGPGCHFYGGRYVGAFVGSSRGSGWVTIENCGNEASVGSEYDKVSQNGAAFIGVVVGGGPATRITNCYNTGTIVGASESAVLTGWFGGHGSVEVNNFYNIGSVQGTEGDNLFYRNNTGITFNNVYDLNGKQGATQITNEQVKSGKLCVTLGSPFTQDLSDDNHPTFGSKTVTAGQWLNEDVYYNKEGDDYTVYQLNFNDTKTVYDIPANVTATNVKMTPTLSQYASDGATPRWNTFCSPVALPKSNFSAVKELSGVTANNDNYTMTFTDIAGDNLVAGKPYMVQVASSNPVFTATNATVATAASTSDTFNGLTFNGTFTKGFAPLNSFIISDNVFYQVDQENTVNLKAFRGYITIAGVGGSVKAINFDFDDDDATGISLTPALSEGEGAIYNVAGQRVSKMQKGINIVNGKKILK